MIEIGTAQVPQTFNSEWLESGRRIKAYLRWLMQLEEGIMGNLLVCFGGHHSDSFYDGRWLVGFIVQKNNTKSNRELKKVRSAKIHDIDS